MINPVHHKAVDYEIDIVGTRSWVSRCVHLWGDERMSTKITLLAASLLIVLAEILDIFSKCCQATPPKTVSVSTMVRESLPFESAPAATHTPAPTGVEPSLNKTDSTTAIPSEAQRLPASSSKAHIKPPTSATLSSMVNNSLPFASAAAAPTQAQSAAPSSTLGSTAATASSVQALPAVAPSSSSVLPVAPILLDAATVNATPSLTLLTQAPPQVSSTPVADEESTKAELERLTAARALEFGHSDWVEGQSTGGSSRAASVVSFVDVNSPGPRSVSTCSEVSTTSTGSYDHVSLPRSLVTSPVDFTNAHFIGNEGHKSGVQAPRASWVDPASAAQQQISDSEHSSGLWGWRSSLRSLGEGLRLVTPKPVRSEPEYNNTPTPAGGTPMQSSSSPNTAEGAPAAGIQAGQQVRSAVNPSAKLPTKAPSGSTKATDK